MNVPPQLSFRRVRKTPGLEELLRNRIEKLEKVCSYVSSCRVAVEKPHEHQDSGNPYRVRVDVTVPPGRELVATAGQLDNDLHDALKTVVNDAFDAMERQLGDLVERQRRDVKSHPDEDHGIVVKLFDDEGYGFLKAVDDGREVYFHRAAVLHDDFDHLTVGTEVRFVETMGEQGLQASTVQIVGKPGVREAQAEEQAVPVPESWGGEPGDEEEKAG